MAGRFETYAFLPPLTPSQVRLQVEDILTRKLVPMIEYAESPNCEDIYWHMWPLPDQKEVTTSWLMGQMDACSRSNPYAYIRISGYHKARGHYTRSFIVKTPLEVA